MGLHKSDIVAAGIIAVAGVFGIFGPVGRAILRWERSAIELGEVWRLLSGHFVHLGLSHLLLNVAGLVLVWYLAGRDLKPVQWLIVVSVSVLGIDAGFWILNPELVWYVGLSGVLHGMLAAGIVVAASDDRKDLVLLGVLVVAKLVYEQVAGALPGSAGAAGGPVVVDAHLYGAVSGAVTGAIMRRLNRTT
jgi:rhomboid family GlyGly-CTERM serine protease